AITSDALWWHTDQNLREALTTADEVEVEGRRYRRLDQASSATYYGRWGNHPIEEALYREVGVHNGPTVKPLKLRVGIIEHMTPDMARIAVRPLVRGLATLCGQTPKAGSRYLLIRIASALRRSTPARCGEIGSRACARRGSPSAPRRGWRTRPGTT